MIGKIVRLGIKLMVAIALTVAFMVALILTLQAEVPPRAAWPQSTALSSSMNNGILPESGAYHGAVISLEQIDAFECMVGKKLKVIKIYQHFHNGDFYEDLANFIHNRGAIEFLSFDPVVSETITYTCNGRTEVVSRTLYPTEVTSSAYDGVITQFASRIKEWGHPLILSFAGEMNGCWCPPVNWQGCYNTPNGPEKYIQMYRYVHDKFSTVGADNVMWAWVVNHESIPNEAWNQVDKYYPGDEYVDIISVDGYNWGDDGPGGCPVDVGWKTFDEIFGAILASLSSTHPTKPLMLGEFASVEGTDPLSKTNWITDAYNHIKTDWPQIKAAVWFNVLGDCSFQVESSLQSIWAYREAVADSYFISRAWCSYLPLVYKAYPFCTNSGRGGTETVKIEPSRAIGNVHIDLIERALKQYGFSLWEVEIYGPGTNNLAIGATATASSWQDGYGCYDCSPEKAIDGRMDTRWSSDFHEPQWLTITLPAPQVVSRIVLKWEAAYAEEYCVEVTQ